MQNKRDKRQVQGVLHSFLTPLPFELSHELNQGIEDRGERIANPQGVDLIRTNSISNRFAPGGWEGQARETALSLEHWTIGLALASILVIAALALRGQLNARRVVDLGTPLEGVHAPDATPPGLGG